MPISIQLHAIVTWQLFCLKHLAAQSSDADTLDVLDPLHVEVIQQQKGLKQLSLKQALIAIAALAGFVPSTKQPLPGEKTIWRG
ncbi:hypothetical protein D770_22840 [Flammeovirgaceae bacterium 311]|nr:hypothetical protein D770_22840 [Flammeovirgaceae bacterium 311]